MVLILCGALLACVGKKCISNADELQATQVHSVAKRLSAVIQSLLKSLPPIMYAPWQPCLLVTIPANHARFLFNLFERIRNSRFEMWFSPKHWILVDWILVAFAF